MSQVHQPITYSSYVTLNLLEYPQLFLYSDGFMDKGLTLRSFHVLNGSLFHDFQNAVFRIIPVMNHRMCEQLAGELNFDALDDKGDGKEMSNQ